MPMNPQEEMEVMAGLDVVDLAAGSGVFLLAWLEAVEWRCNAAFPDATRQRTKEVIEMTLGHLHLVDISEAALDVFRKSVEVRWGVTASCNLHVMNALSDECLEVIPKMDIVLGNPPYIGEKNNRHVFDDIKECAIFNEFYQAKMDYHHFFIYRGTELMKADGILSYLIPDYFMTSDGAEKLRRFILERTVIRGFIDFQTMGLFNSAKGHHSSILTLSHKEWQSKDDMMLVMKPQGKGELAEVLERYLTIQSTSSVDPACDGVVDGGDWCFWMPMKELTPHGDYLTFDRVEVTRLLRRINQICTVAMDDIYEVNQGIVSGCDRMKDSYSDNGVFVLTWDEAEEQHIERKLLRPFFKNSQIGHFSLLEKDESKWCIIYVDDWIDGFETAYPNTFNHLSVFREKLSKRRECINGTRPWYGLQWPRRPEIFERMKIVAPQRSKSNRFAWVERDFYGSADIYYLAPRIRTELGRIGSGEYMAYDTVAMTGILNSSLCHFLLSYGGKKKGDLLELYATPLKKIPVPHPVPETLDVIRTLARGFIDMPSEGTTGKMALEDDANMVKLNAAVYALYGLQTDEVQLVEAHWKEWSR